MNIQVFTKKGPQVTVARQRPYHLWEEEGREESRGRGG